MKCLCCDKTLNDFESTRRHATTNDFLDLCNKCHYSVSMSAVLPTIDRKDLINGSVIEEEVDNIEDIWYPNFKEL